MNEVITEKDYSIQGLWVLKSISPTLLILIIFGPLFLIASLGGAQEAGSGFSFYLIWFSVFAIFHLIVTILRRANFHYSIENQFLTLKQGILSKQQRHIPYGVVQNLFVKQDLFDRIFGLASLTIENAAQGAGYQAAGKQRQQVEMVGFSGNKVNIPGLTKTDAETLKGIVLQKMKENPIEDSQSGL